MPASSKQQQKLMGIVRALQKGDLKPSQVSDKAKDMAKSMKKSDVKDFASTKHKGLPKKVKKENMGVASMYAVLEATPDMKEQDLVVEFNPLEGVQPLNVDMNRVHDVFLSADEARAIAAEVYKKCMDEAFQLEEKKGKVGDKLKKAIDQLEKKRKEHIDMAKEDPKNASQHKEHIAKLASQIDDLMSKMEKIEKSKKNVEKKEDKKEDLKEEVKTDQEINISRLKQSIELDQIWLDTLKNMYSKSPTTEIEQRIKDQEQKIKGLKAELAKKEEELAQNN